MTRIEWTHRPGTKGVTWNPIVGCTPVSAGCANCYAAPMARRLASMGIPRYRGLLTRKGAFNGTVRCVQAALEAPLRWRKPRTVFVCSMSDLFHEDVPDEFIMKVFIAMAMCPQHTFQVLTKRPERMAEFCRQRPWFAKTIRRADGRKTFTCSHTVLPNVWLGTTVENQAAADERIPHLLKCPAALRFLSCEPLLDRVDVWKTFRQIDWIIIGGESGHHARSLNTNWIRGLIAQCQTTGAKIFLKQLGTVWAREHGLRGKGNDPATWPEDLRVQEWPTP